MLWETDHVGDNGGGGGVEPCPALPKLKPTFLFLPFPRDSSRKHDKMRPKIIFGAKVYFSMACLH